MGGLAGAVTARILRHFMFCDSTQYQPQHPPARSVLGVVVPTIRYILTVICDTALEDDNGGTPFVTATCGPEHGDGKQALTSHDSLVVPPGGDVR